MNRASSEVNEPFVACPVWSTVGGHYDWPRETGAHDEDYVLHGRFDDLPRSQTKVVRIFLSSTFTDTYSERNLLIKNVYPKLKKMASEKYGLDFQVVDMRWGIRDEATVDHSTSALCMHEIANCKNVSIGPTFVALLSHRYGGRSLPTVIPAGEMDAILKSLNDMETGNDDIELLAKWFKLDTNAVPPEYCLLSIIDNDQVESFLKEQDVTVEKYKRGLNSVVYDENIKEDTNDVAAQKREGRLRYAEMLDQGKKQWRIDEPRLINIIRSGVLTCIEQGTITKQDSLKYFRSITEEEIRRGILQESNVSDRCLVFIRNIENLNLRHKKAWRFIDMENDVVDKDAQVLLETLKEATLPECVPKENIFKFSTTWSDNDGINETDHASYLKKFCETFENEVWKLIQRHAEKNKFLSESNLYTEVLEHSYHCVQKGKTFYGRQDILETIKSYIASTSVQPMVIFGESGAGKTSVLAKAAMQMYSWLGNGKDICTILRFLGTTPSSSTIFDLLASISRQIIESTGLHDMYKQLPDDITELQKVFEQILSSVPTNMKVIIITDSVDQLSEKENAQQLFWLPHKLPHQVKMIVSLIGDKRTLRKKMPMLKENQFVEVGGLNSSTGQNVLSLWLDTANRCLSQEQKEMLENLVKGQVSPLYIKLVFDEIKKWKSYDSPTFDCTTIPSCLQRLYRRLETKHGAVIISKAFGYLAASRNGLTETEMEDVLSIDDDVLTDVFQFHVPPVRRLPSILWSRIRSDVAEYIIDRGADGVKVMSWYHRQFLQEARKRYLPTKTARISLNTKPLTTTKNYRLYKTLAEYFAGIWANNEEKPFTYTAFQLKRLGLSEPESSACRYVADQPTTYGSNVSATVESEVKYNTRKLSELPSACLNVLKHEDITPFVAVHVALNQEFLAAWFRTSRWEEISDFFKELTEEHQHVESSYDMQKQMRDLVSQECAENEVRKAINSSTFGKLLQISAVYRCLLLCSARIQNNPNMLGTDIVGRLLVFSNVADGISDWIKQNDGAGRNVCALVPPHQQLRTPGGELQTIIDIHEGPIQELISYKGSFSHYLMSTSRKFALITLENAEVLIDVAPPSMPKNDVFHKAVVCQQHRSGSVYFVSLQCNPVVYMFSMDGKELAVFNLSAYTESKVQISDLKVMGQDNRCRLFVIDCPNNNLYILSNLFDSPVNPECEIMTCKHLPENRLEIDDGKSLNAIVHVFIHPDEDQLLILKDFGFFELYNSDRDLLGTRSFEWSSVKLVSHIVGSFGEMYVAISFVTGQICLIKWESRKETLKHLHPQYLISEARLKKNMSYGIPLCLNLTQKSKDKNNVVGLACTGEYLLGFTCHREKEMPSSSEEDDSVQVVTRDVNDRLKLLFRIRRNFTMATLSKYMKHLIACKEDNIYIFKVITSAQNQEILKLQYLTSIKGVGQNIKGVIIHAVGGQDRKFTVVCQNSQMRFYDLKKLGLMDDYIPKYDRSVSEISEILATDDSAITFGHTSRYVHQWNIVQGRIVGSFEHPNQQCFLKLATDDDQQYIALLDKIGGAFMWQKIPENIHSNQVSEGHTKSSKRVQKINIGNFTLVTRFQTSLTDIENCKKDDIFMLLLPNQDMLLATKHHAVPLHLTLSDNSWKELKLTEITGPFKHVCQLQNNNFLFVSQKKLIVFDIVKRHTCCELLTCDISLWPLMHNCDFQYAKQTNEVLFVTGKTLIPWKPTERNFSDPIILEGLEQETNCKLFQCGNKRLVILQEKSHSYNIVDMHTKCLDKTGIFGTKEEPVDQCTVSPDGKYIVYIAQGKELYLHRLSDGKVLAWYTVYENVISLTVSTNSWFVLLGTSDKRLFVLIIADQDEPTHVERIGSCRKGNPSLSTENALIALGLLDGWHFNPEDDADSSDEETIHRRAAATRDDNIKVTSAYDSSSEEERDDLCESHVYNDEVYSLTPCSVQ